VSCQSPFSADAGARALSQMIVAGLRNMTLSMARIVAWLAA
jgi:hypothetical protein